MPARLLSRRPVPLIAAVTAALLAPMLLASPVSAAPPDPVVAAYEVPLGDQVGELTGTTYGSATATGPQIAVSASTETLFVQFRVSDTDCWFRSSDGTTLAAETWYGSGEEEPPGRLFAIPAGSIADGARYVVVTRTSLSADMGGAVTVTLPRISRGTHSVVGVFQTSDTCVGSVSPAKTLRVLV